MSDALLDIDKIVELRVRRGLSARALARQMGVSSATVHRLEQGDWHSDLSLRTLYRLADALNIDIRVLLSDRTGSPLHGDDDAVLEAALASAAAPVERERIARTLGWSLARLDEAVGSLRARLHSRGVSLSGAGALSLVAKEHLLTDRQRATLAQTATAKRGIDLRTMQLLRAVALGTIESEWERRASNPQRIALARLANLGLARRTADGMRLTATARFSLGLEELAAHAVPKSPRARGKTNRREGKSRSRRGGSG